MENQNAPLEHYPKLGNEQSHYEEKSNAVIRILEGLTVQDAEIVLMITRKSLKDNSKIFFEPPQLMREPGDNSPK